MPASGISRPVPLIVGLVAVAASVLGAARCPAIEMFTFFGDGSRIGLPSLEVPIEAYPGIPLRSDRIRARRRTPQGRSPTMQGRSQPVPAAGITIRTMPGQSTPVPRRIPASPQRTGGRSPVVAGAARGPDVPVPLGDPR